MPRHLRVEFSGAIYHVTIRGNARQKIFNDDHDRERFLQRLSDRRRTGLNHKLKYNGCNLLLNGTWGSTFLIDISDLFASSFANNERLCWFTGFSDRCDGDRWILAHGISINPDSLEVGAIGRKTRKTGHIGLYRPQVAIKALCGAEKRLDIVLDLYI